MPHYDITRPSGKVARRYFYRGGGARAARVRAIKFVKGNYTAYKRTAARFKAFGKNYKARVAGRPTNAARATRWARYMLHHATADAWMSKPRATVSQLMS